jgi:hypothetical protein
MTSRHFIEGRELSNVLALLRAVPVTVTSKRFLFWQRLRVSGPDWAIKKADDLIARHFGALRDEQVW